MIILQVVVFPMLQSTSESDEPIHIINVGIKFSKKEKYSDNDLAVRFQDFCKERVRALICILFVLITVIDVACLDINGMLMNYCLCLLQAYM